MPEGSTLRPYRTRCGERRRELDAVLKRLIATARDLSDVERIIVFGSYALDRISPWSDLDVLVVRSGGPPDLVDDLYRRCGGASIFGMRAADYPLQLEATPIGRTILREGREVYARSAR